MSNTNRVTKNVAIKGQKNVLRISLSSFLITVEVIYKNTLKVSSIGGDLGEAY